jgi:hypothetical protein
MGQQGLLIVIPCTHLLDICSVPQEIEVLCASRLVEDVSSVDKIRRGCGWVFMLCVLCNHAVSWQLAIPLHVSLCIFDCHLLRERKGMNTLT